MSLNINSNESCNCNCSSDQTSVDHDKRKWLIATSIAGGIGITGIAIPLVTTFSPSEKAKAAGAPVEIDIGGMKPGELRTTEWRGKPVWVVRRTPEMIEALAHHDSQLADPNSERKPSEFTPEYARNTHRSIKAEYLVTVGICTHLGCSPVEKFQPGANQSLPNDWPGGFFCPCHGSTFDLAGRVFKNKPAPDNLEIPPHMYISDTRILIGQDNKA
jgi:ubiquinol-cytochrome c reductase iron-sulfur subunit